MARRNSFTDDNTPSSPPTEQKVEAKIDADPPEAPEVKQIVDKVTLDTLFNQKTLAPDTIQVAIMQLKDKFIRDQSIDIDEIERIASLLSKAVADRSQAREIIASINQYLTSNDYLTFKKSLFNPYEKGIQFLDMEEERKLAHASSQETKQVIDKDSVNKIFNPHFRRETVAADDIKLAIDQLKEKFIKDQSISLKEMETTANALSKGLADRSQTAVIIASINQYLTSGDYSSFEKSLHVPSQKGMLFFTQHRDRIISLTQKSQQDISKKIMGYTDEIKKILASKYKGNTDNISNPTVTILTHLAPIWIGRNDTLIRNSQLGKSELEIELKKTEKEVHNLYLLMRDIVSLDVKKLEQIDLVKGLLDTLNINIREYPARTEQMIYQNMADLFLGFGTQHSKSAPDFGTQLTKLAAKYSEMAGPPAKKAAGPGHR